MAKRLLFSSVCVFSALAVPAAAQNYQKSVIYQIVTDRFYDGDT